MAEMLQKFVSATDRLYEMKRVLLRQYRYTIKTKESGAKTKAYV